MHLRALFDATPTAAALEYLRTELKIHIVEDTGHALVSLKYNQLESPMAHPMVQECRGTVVDISSDRAKVLAWPYNKFWNHGDLLAAPIDWATARVLEKLDGSLMILYWHSGWMVASSGHPTAGGSFGSDARSFRDAFWATFHALGMRFPGVDHAGTATFMFELCDMPNRVVVRHDRPRLVLHGARWLDGREFRPDLLRELANDLRWEHVRDYPIDSIHGCLEAAEALNPIENEGFVVVDANCNRVKIKSPRYVILHHMKGEATPRRAIELWQTGETSELLTHFPEMAGAILPVQEQLEQAAVRAHETYAAFKDAPTQKDFALAVKDLPGASVVFLLRKAPEPSVEAARAIMRGLTTQALERLLDA